MSYFLVSIYVYLFQIAWERDESTFCRFVYLEPHRIRVPLGAYRHWSLCWRKYNFSSMNSTGSTPPWTVMDIYIVWAKPIICSLVGGPWPWKRIAVLDVKTSAWPWISLEANYWLNDLPLLHARKAFNWVFKGPSSPRKYVQFHSGLFPLQSTFDHRNKCKLNQLLVKLIYHSGICLTCCISIRNIAEEKMLTQSTAVLILAFLIGCSMTTTVAGHKNKGDKSAGFPGNVMRAAGTCPQGTRLVVGMNSPGLLTGNFLPRCEPFSNTAFPL